MLAAAVLLTQASCQKDNAWSASQDKSYKDDIQLIVEDKIAQQSEVRTGQTRLQLVEKNTYQDATDISTDPQRQLLDERRRRVAKELLQAGPLSLRDCMAYSLEFNDVVQADRYALRSLGGDKLLVNSRFLPQLAVDMAHVPGEGSFLPLSSGLGALGNLLEFGREHSEDIALRALQRAVLFKYEQDVAAVLSEIRLRYFTILLKQRQTQQRQELLKEFTARYERMQKLQKYQRVLEVDVMSAKLSVLNERMRINSLQKEILRQKMDLLHLVGFPLDLGEVQLDGQIEPFNLSPQRAVQIAFKRSTGIAQARASLYERDRQVRQMVWDYLPVVNSQSGHRGGFTSMGTGMQTVNGNYGAGPFGEQRWNSTNWQAGDYNRMAADSGWYYGYDINLPIFSGLARTGKFQRARALMDQDRRLLCDAIAATELDVLKSYQTVLERDKETEILEETVAISKERLRVKERLKELGTITDNELETFRDRFFSDQDAYFQKQLQLIEAQERLRLSMRYFQPLPALPKIKGFDDVISAQK